MPLPRSTSKQSHPGGGVGAHRGGMGAGDGIGGGEGAQSPPSKPHSGELQLYELTMASHMPSPNHQLGHAQPTWMGGAADEGGELVQSPPSYRHSAVLQSWPCWPLSQ